MGVTVAPNYSAWQALFPEFANVSLDQYAMYFDMATQFCRNDGCGPVSKVEVQTRLLNLMTAHWAQLLAGNSTSGGASPLVGRISNASEGSVSVATENNYPPGTAQWFQQTKYGSAFWAGTSQYRSARYRAPRGGNGTTVGLYNPLILR